MRHHRAGTKKLIVAFHFQFANQAAWKCDECRKAGLELKRRCGWVQDRGPEHVVWARRQIATTECPRSLITAESLRLLESFHVWKALGTADVQGAPARAVDALFILEREWRTEARNGEQYRSE